MNILTFVNNVISVMHPVWVSAYFQVPAVFALIILLVCVVRWIVSGGVRGDV